MKQPANLDDSELEHHLRAGLDALAVEVGDPPPLPTTVESPSTGHGRRYATAAVIVVAVLVASAVTWSLLDDAPTQQLTVEAEPEEAFAGSDLPLAGTRWWLQAAEDDGQLVVAEPTRAVGLQVTEAPQCDDQPASPCEEGPVLWASDSCNGVTRPAEVRPSTIVLGEQGGPTLLTRCIGPLANLLGGVFMVGELEYEVSGDRLEVTRGSAVLTYVASNGPFGPTEGTVIDAGTVDSKSFRVVWSNGGLEFQTGDTDTAIAVGGSGLGDDPGRINMARNSVLDQPYVFAIVPRESARVVYEPDSAKPQDLTISPVDSPTSSVVASFVDDAPAAWQLVAYDADGIELHRYRWGPREDFGAGLSLEELVPTAGLDGCCTTPGARVGFTADGIEMTIASSPLPPSQPRDPAEGLTDPARIDLASGATALTGTVRDEAAIRFDCAETRYEVRAPLPAPATLPEVAARLSTAAGCPQMSIAKP